MAKTPYFDWDTEFEKVVNPRTEKDEIKKIFEETKQDWDKKVPLDILKSHSQVLEAAKKAITANYDELEKLIFTFFASWAEAHQRKVLNKEDLDGMKKSVLSCCMSRENSQNQAEADTALDISTKISKLRSLDKIPEAKKFLDQAMLFVVLAIQTKNNYKKYFVDTSVRNLQANKEMASLFGFCDLGTTPYKTIFALYTTDVAKYTKAPTEEEKRELETKIAAWEKSQEEWANNERERKRKLREKRKAKEAKEKAAAEEEKKKKKGGKTNPPPTKEELKKKGAKAEEGAKKTTGKDTPEQPPKKVDKTGDPKKDDTTKDESKPVKKTPTVLSTKDIVKLLEAEPKLTKPKEDISALLKKLKQGATTDKINAVLKDDKKFKSDSVYTRALVYILSFVPTIYQYLDKAIQNAIKENSALLNGLSAIAS